MRGTLAGIGAVLGLGLALASCEPRPPEPGPAPVLYIAGEERGYLEPCGCTRPQLGGLARKATALGGAPLLENGDLVDRPGRLAQLKFEAFLLALSEIGCRALNVGEGDLALGLDFLRSAAGMARFPLVSANLLDEQGERVFPASAAFDTAGGRVLAIGVLDPALAPGLPLADPAPSAHLAMAQALTSDGPGPDRVVLLFHGTRERAAALFGALEWIDTIVCAHGNGEPDVRDPRLVCPGDRSRWMVRLGESASVVELSEDFANDPRMDRALRDYVARLEEEDLLHRMNPRGPVEGGGYAGDRACATCHAAAAAVHASSRHARAIESLRRTGRHVDPDCVGCHVIGYGRKTGFLSAGETPDLARVGCESCHGPGSDHARDPAATRTAKDARAACFDCHTEDTDPGFAFGRKWPAIRHE